MRGYETLWNLWNHWDEYKKNIPETRGIYRIVLPEGMHAVFSAEIKGHPVADAYDVGLLENKYEQTGCSELLYIGKAGGRRGLRQRIRQYLLYGFGEGNNHRGGRAIFQITEFEKLICVWEECVECEKEEHRLLKEFFEACGEKTYPVANWRG